MCANKWAQIRFQSFLETIHLKIIKCINKIWHKIKSWYVIKSKKKPKYSIFLCKFFFIMLCFCFALFLLLLIFFSVCVCVYLGAKWLKQPGSNSNRFIIFTFGWITSGKVKNPLILTHYWHSTRHLITHEGLYATLQRSHNLFIIVKFFYFSLVINSPNLKYK